MRSLSRRDVLKMLLAVPVIVLPACATGRTSPQRDHGDALAKLERQHGGRLGVCILDTATGAELRWRGDERFALCSTFKLPLAATVLRAVELGELDGNAPVPFGPADLVPHAPVVQARLDAGVTSMTALELAEAAQLTSDNVAANLLLRQLGGPAGVTESWRARGDDVTRLDRFEPAMNHVLPGEEHDTTTPCAMARHVAALVTGDLLSADSRDLLRQWLVATDTGLRRLRAGLPPHWPAGDKTGTGIAPTMANKLNDVAVAWPPGRAPLVVAAYYESRGHSPGTWRDEESIFPPIARIAAAWLDGLD
ncbi:class A beta-lactamase [Pseudofulvimonas gallinarii]|jgi:beta-lactamase class A|uniref:Beta-lactamase n=1 Tax=Pseudofulvimonas gallinarii TaxID=634155 RepID=A0A4S3KVZ4_9GAMM|nr:class A beta-lactamase [Pseudofulvimonas gallinarii]TCS96013.1 beta-lactamase class A [Pseudofulvimonas gallinarii]THD13316.1 hypothetical protein B1808_08795 [Pseudofulvimonas gallinarii]